LGLAAEQIFLGIMSGTSCDGLDLALVGFSETEREFGFRWIDQRMIPYEESMQQSLISCSKMQANELAQFENEWTNWVADTVKAFLEHQSERPCCIGFHGHTVFHRPELGYTVQMGSGASLAAKCRIDVVCNFRQQDVASGGQGAPLVPVAERDLFPKYDAFLNLGGFANATVRDSSGIRAFDICGANIVLNNYTMKLGMQFDCDGKLARSGSVNSELIALLVSVSVQARGNTLNSLGIEWVEKHIFPTLDAWIDQQVNQGNDLTTYITSLVASYTEFIAIECAKQFSKGSTVLLSGGGAHNIYLTERMRYHAHAELIVADKRLTDFKEALAFAYLAFCRVNGRENTLISVTGAKRASHSGAWYKA
jgi:anhydro-N-acetylmuramic acid kinase